MRKRSSLWLKACWAIWRSVLSMLMPTIFTDRPALSRTTVAREEIQRTSPSGRVMRKSHSQPLPLATASAYIACMCCTSSPGRCFQKSSLWCTGQPYTCSTLGE
ncbi:hypothetical protein D3C75_1075390 [compost metagenome]